MANMTLFVATHNSVLNSDDKSRFPDEGTQAPRVLRSAAPVANAYPTLTLL